MSRNDQILVGWGKIHISWRSQNFCNKMRKLPDKGERQSLNNTSGKKILDILPQTIHKTTNDCTNEVRKMRQLGAYICKRNIRNDPQKKDGLFSQLNFCSIVCFRDQRF